MDGWIEKWMIGWIEKIDGWLDGWIEKNDGWMVRETTWMVAWIENKDRWIDNIYIVSCLTDTGLGDAQVL